MRRIVMSRSSPACSDQRVAGAACIPGFESLERRALMAATISGSVMRDMTGDGLTADDQPLSGVVVKLYKDLNGNGALDSSDGAAIKSKTTGASGNFSFTNLAQGKYLVQDKPSSNQVRTAPLLSSTIAVNVNKKNGNFGDNVFANFVKDFKRSNISNITYTINGTETVSTLAGNVEENDIVTVNFKVASGKTAKLSLVTYHNPLNTNSAAALAQQELFDFETGTFGEGRHSLTVLVPDCFFQIDFVGGSVIEQFGPAGSNINYTNQGRLIASALGGVNACEPHEDDHLSGRMTGGGSIFLPAGATGGSEGTRVTHGFQLHCAQPPQEVNNRLQINWNQSSFHLLTLTFVECFDTPLQQAPPKHAPIDTLHGIGDGRFNGTFNGVDYKKAAAMIDFTLTDDGEPGRNDTSDYRIVVLDGNLDGVANDPVVVLDTGGPVVLTFGNHQAHREIARLIRLDELA